MKLVFLDTEFTGEHALTTLVSIGLVTLEGEELYITLNDYSEDQVSNWLRKNVLNMIDETKSITSIEAFKLIAKWLESYSGGDKINLVSAGKGLDLTLLFELFKYSNKNLKYFHALHCLPNYLNHSSHIDLNTLFLISGIEPDIDRDFFARGSSSNRRHNALHDAIIVRECFLKLKSIGAINKLFNEI